MKRDPEPMGKVLRRKELEEVIGLKRSTIYARMDPDSKYFDPTFPKKIKLGGRAGGWPSEEVYRWLESRARHGDAPVPADPKHASVAGAVRPKGKAVVDEPATPENAKGSISDREVSSRDAELVLSELARAGKTVSLYQFLERLQEQIGNNGLFLTDPVLDAIDLASFREFKTLPSVLIQEKGAPLGRAWRLAGTLGIELTKETVMAQRQQLFLACLRPSDPRPTGFRWFDVRGHSVMSPYYHAHESQKEAPLTSSEKTQSDAMHARYEALLPPASRKTDQQT